MSKAEELRRSRPTRLVSSASAIWSWQFRIILVGDSTVGKSALLKRFTEGSFAETSDPTVSFCNEKISGYHYSNSSCSLQGIPSSLGVEMLDFLNQSNGFRWVSQYQLTKNHMYGTYVSLVMFSCF